MSLTKSKMDKTTFQVATMDDESDEKAYWFARTPHERLAALELLRQVMYGYDPLTTRLQRILTTAEHI